MPAEPGPAAYAMAVVRLTETPAARATRAKRRTDMGPKYRSQGGRA